MPDNSLLRLSGSHRTCGHAHLFTQLRTRRISQFCGLDSPNGPSISPLPAWSSVPHAVGFFLKISRAAFLSTRRPIRLDGPAYSDSGDRYPLEQLLVPVEDGANLVASRIRDSVTKIG